MYALQSDRLSCSRISNIYSTVSAADSDIAIRSSDGVIFKLHLKNLEAYSEIFPSGKTLTMHEIVELTESASTLKLLFQYIYPEKSQPDLEKIMFGDLKALAEAVEKYRMLPAMEVCKAYMRSACIKYCVRSLTCF